MKTFKIEEVTYEHIKFTNGKEITYDHRQDCCECNYADFNQIDDLAYHWTFVEPLEFETVQGSGFRFGNDNKKVFIPCYSEQNGYYTTELDIYYDGHVVSSLECQEVFD